METPVARVCPTCHQKNEMDGTTCVYCGADLNKIREQPRVTENVQGKTVDLPKIEERPDVLQDAISPASGVAIYVTGITKPVAIVEEAEFCLGRKFEEIPDSVIDLTPYGATALGVSRRHAVIRKGDKGYEITDLNSTNGTWMKDQRLVPFRSYSISSGVPFRLGHLFLFFIVKEE